MRRLILSCLLATLAALLPGAQATPSGAIQLAQDCPTGFELVAGQCRLQTPYRQYGSLQNQGVGGLKTGLPALRDGFTPREIDLGRYLFFDPLLSRDGSVSCAHCHQPDKGFSDGLARSKGIGGQEIDRNAPTLWNVALLQRFFWDGRAHSLEEQMQGPLYSAKEMGNTRENLLATLNGSKVYRELFGQTFADAKPAIQADHVYRALAAFESSLISLNSRYDLYAFGVHEALNAREVAGLNVFRSFVARCAECHTPPTFTNQQIAVLGTPSPKGHAFDAGAEAITHEPSQRGGFKVPTLRNIALTGPYEHSGVFSNLRDAVEFYNLGRGHAVPKGEKLVLHWHIWEPKLRPQEIDDVVAFLQTLTDESLKPKAPGAVPSGLPPGL